MFPFFVIAQFSLFQIGRSEILGVLIVCLLLGIVGQFKPGVRRWLVAFAAIFAIAMICTPADPYSTLLLAITMCILLVVGVALSQTPKMTTFGYAAIACFGVSLISSVIFTQVPAPRPDWVINTSALLTRLLLPASALSFVIVLIGRVLRLKESKQQMSQPKKVPPP